MARMHESGSSVLVVAALCLAVGSGCPPPTSADAGVDSGPGWTENCGDPASLGNNQSVGHYCARDADCFEVDTDLPDMHCSTVLADNAIPNLCSSICEPGETDCGEGTICASLSSIGHDIIACVPDECRGAFPSVFEEYEAIDGGAPLTTTDGG